MGNYILKRVLTFLPILLIMSLVIFFIIQLPPGDYLTSYVAGLKAEGQIVDESELASLKERYGLDQPWFMQYFKWMANILTRFDFGYSFKYEAPVWSTIASVLPMTIVVSLVTMLFNYLVGIPIGIYSAVHQYSIGDYCFTLLGFIGMAVPNFLFAILLMYGTYIWTGTAFIGLYTGTCGTLRSMRAQMLDELGRNYVLCARAKGVSEKRIVYKYCLRAALNPTVSGLSGVLSHIFNGSTISAIVMNLQLVGPMLYEALKAQDMYLAGTILLVMGFLIIIGTLLSDILLAWLDPRIRFSGRRAE